MKRFFVFAAIFLVLASCGDPSDETWLKISAIAPPPGATIGVNTNISFKIDYNIATEVLEMDGFIITIASMSSEYYSVIDKKMNATKRSGSFIYNTEGNRLSPYLNSNIIKIEISICQKNGNNIIPITNPEKIEYFFDKIPF